MSRRPGGSLSRVDCGKRLAGFGISTGRGMLPGVGRALPPLPRPLPFCARAGDADARNAATVSTETGVHIFFMGQTSQWRPSDIGHPAVKDGMAHMSIVEVDWAWRSVPAGGCWQPYRGREGIYRQRDEWPCAARISGRVKPLGQVWTTKSVESRRGDAGGWPEHYGGLRSSLELTTPPFRMRPSNPAVEPRPRQPTKMQLSVRRRDEWVAAAASVQVTRPG